MAELKILLILMAKIGEKVASIAQKLTRVLFKRNTLILLLAFVILFQYVQARGSILNVNSLSSRESSLIEELGQLKETYTSFGDDLNEVRQYLRMPTKDYQPIAEQSGDDDGSNQDKIQLAMFEYIDYLTSARNTADKLGRNQALIDNLLIDKEFLNFLKRENFVLAPVVRNKDNVVVKINDKSGSTLITYFFNKNDGSLFFTTINKKTEVATADFVKFKQDLMDFLVSNKDSLLTQAQAVKSKQTQIVSAINATQTQDTLKKQGLYFSPNSEEKDLQVIYSIFNKANELVGEVILSTDSLATSLVDANDQNTKIKSTDLLVDLTPFLEKLDARTFVEQKAVESIDSFKKTMEDDGFLLLLTKNNLHLAKPNEDEGRFYYQILDKDNKVVSTFAIEKMTGIITITDSEGQKGNNLLFFDPSLKKKL